MANKWRRYIKHPLIIGSILSFLVIFSLAKFLPYYITEKIEESNITNNGEVYFFDLNHNGNSEKLNYYHYDRIFQPTLYLYSSKNKLITFWNFADSPVANYKLFTGDYNNDKLDEIFTFTRNSDSIFLHVFKPNRDSKPVVDREFISEVSSDGDNIEIHPVGLYDLNNRNNKEFIFYIDAGYPFVPRKLFAFNFDSHTVKSSPEISVDIQSPVLVEDINADQKLEIIISNRSVELTGIGNRSQLIVLDNDLSYLFQPKDYLGNSSQISVKTVLKNKEKLLAVLRSGTSKDVFFNDLMLYNFYGEKIDEVSLKYNSNLILTSIFDNSSNLYLFTGKGIIKYNSNFEKTEEFNISKTKEFNFNGFEDLIGDNRNEYIFSNNQELILLSNNLKHKATFNLENTGKELVSKVVENGKVKAISIQSGEKWSLYEFYENKAFFHSSIFYFLIFLSVTFFTFLISKLWVRLGVIGKSLFKTSEEGLILEIEENLKEKFTNLKQQVDKIGEKIGEKSHEQLLSKIDDTYEDVKAISKQLKVKVDSTNFVQNINNLIKDVEGLVKPKLYLYSENDFLKLNPEIGKFIISICRECLGFISEFEVKEQLSLQIIEHSKYINLLFEIEGLYIKPEDLGKNQEISSIIEEANGKIELANISNYGTIINASIPLGVDEKITGKPVKKVKVIIAEDHDVSLFGLISLFKTKEDIEVVGTAKNGMEVLKLLETEDTDVVITDISMPGMDGIELAERLKKEYPRIKVIVFTMYMENWFVEQLIKHGAKGFVSKNSKTNELVGAVRGVMEGNNYYCPQFKSKFGFKGTNNGIKQKLDSLSKNELHIVKQYAENLTKSQIATNMELSPKTMDSFIANILLKLNAGDEDEIIRIAKKQKFVSE